MDTAPLRGNLSSRSLFWGTTISTGLLFVVMSIPHFSGGTYARDDLLAYHLPARQFYAECLQNGDRFDWMPSLFCGFYLTGEGQVGTYHPFHVAIYRCLPLRTAFHLELLISYPLLLLGMFVFLRRHGLGSGAALFGGMLFTFCGFNLRHFVHLNAIAIIAHIPWLLWCIALTMDTTSSRRWPIPQCGIALLTASQILLGYPQYVWFSVVAEASYLFIVHPPMPLFVRRYSEVLFLKLAGLGMGAVQWIPTWDSLRHSLRAIHGPGISDGGLHPVNILQVVAPYLSVPGQSLHEFVLHCGALPAMLAVWCLIGRHKESGGWNRLAVWAVCLAVFAFWMAIGDAGLLYRLQSFLPIVGQFRLPARYAVLCALAVAVLAALAVDVIAHRKEGLEESRRGLIPATTWLPLFCLIITVECLWIWNHWHGGWAGVVAGPLLFTTAAVAMQQSARGRRWALAAVPIIAAVDLGIYGLPYAFLNETPRWNQLTRDVAKPPGDIPGRVIMERQLIAGRPTTFTGNQIILTGRQKADGYFGLIPRRELLGESTSINGLRVANVRWVYRIGKNAEIDGLETHSDSWLRVPNPLPRFRFVTYSQVSDRPAESIRRIDPADTAIVDKPVLLQPGKRGQIHIVADRPGRISLATQCDSRRLLVISESHHDGWTATIDGTPTEIVRVYGQFMGVVVAPGRHDVELEFQPASLRNGKLTSVLSLAILLAYAAVFSLMSRIRHGEAQPHVPQD